MRNVDQGFNTQIACMAYIMKLWILGAGYLVRWICINPLFVTLFLARTERWLRCEPWKCRATWRLGNSVRAGWVPWHCHEVVAAVCSHRDLPDRSEPTQDRDDASGCDNSPTSRSNYLNSLFDRSLTRLDISKSMCGIICHFNRGK